MNVREGDVRDRDAILALRRAAFPDVDVEKQRADFWQWQFGNGRTFVAEESGRVVGHLGFMPMREAMLACDAMVDPAMQGRGIFSTLAKTATEIVRRDAPLVVAWQIRKAVLPAMLRAGYAEVLRAPIVLRPTFAVRASSAQRAARRAVTGDAWTNWRFNENPAWHYAEWRDANGYVVTRDSTLKGILTHCLVDFGGDPRAVIRESIRDARRRGVMLTAALVSRDHPCFGALRRCGYVPGPHRFRFLVHGDVPKKMALTWAATDHV
jgi:GNAT superfamily N-acetyltransferase